MLSEPDVKRNTAGASGFCRGSARRMPPGLRAVPASISSASCVPIPALRSSRKAYSAPSTSIPSRSISFLEVMIRRASVTFMPWARLAGPVVQFIITGVLPAKCSPKKTMSAATLAGSITPTCGSGQAAKRRAISCAPTRSRREESTPEIRSATAGCVGATSAWRTKASATVPASTAGACVERWSANQPAGAGGPADSSSAGEESLPSASAQSSPSVLTTAAV